MVADGILTALAEGERRFGVTAKLILCFLRHLSEDEALATFRQAEPWLDRIAGVGLDSSELGHPPSKFVAVFDAARAAGLKLVAHAGEEGPASYVWEALDQLHVDRIDHGNRSLDDARLVARLAAEAYDAHGLSAVEPETVRGEGLEGSFAAPDAEPGPARHGQFRRPAYFGGYVNDNFRAVTRALGLTKAELVTLAKNSFLGSFLDNDDKARQSDGDRFLRGGELALPVIPGEYRLPRLLSVRPYARAAPRRG